MNCIEEWRPCLPNYEVSNLGRVRRSAPGRKTFVGRLMAPATLKTGYLYVSPTVNGKNKTFYVHELVALAFIGPRPEGASINHIDGIKAHNEPGNLEYVSHAENMRHAAVTGLMARGESHGLSRMTAEDVDGVRDDRRAGLSYSAISRKRGISISHAWQIVKGNAWSHTA